ncbi:MAG: ribosomal protection-like ABC-F family protein [Oscillospiraceae bacterium]
MSIISINDLTFGYEGSYDNVFENVDIDLDSTWRLGLVGRNGKGKTTLLKLLCGCYEYSGSISSEVEFGYFPYDIEDESMLTGDILEGLGSCEEWELIRELTMMNVSAEVLYRPFCTLSGGERTKALLAVMFTGENRFPLIDEPTNNLDEDSRRTVGEYLRRKSGFILISHDRTLLDGCIDHVLSINRKDISLMKGNYSDWQREKDNTDRAEKEENIRLKKEIKRLNESAKRAAEWADISERKKIGFDPTKTEKSLTRRAYEGAKAKKAMARAKAFEERSLKAAEDKSKLLKNIEKSDSLKLSPLKYRGSIIVKAEKAGIVRGGNELFRNISFEVTEGKQLALCGGNGCGKSTLLRMICGIDDGAELTGSLIVGSGLKISYAPQNADHLKGSFAEHADKLGIELTLFLTILRKLDFGREQFEKGLEELSAGQRKKVLLAGSLASQAHLYVWDEPLNFIDVISRRQIEELIKQYRPTMLFAEHDRAFREAVGAEEIYLIK